MSDSIIEKTITATKWSTITEIIAKLIAPITNMILARLLAPSAFGVLTTVLMVIAFAEVFVDTGFQKFIIQHEFSNKEEENKYFTVAFWANLIMGLFLWALIAIFNNTIAQIVGNPGKGNLLIITGIVIPIYSMVGIQISKLKKDLDFRKLFYVRVISAFVPLFITVPLAAAGLDYWSLIIGNIAGVTVNFLILLFQKSFLPSLFFSVYYLKNMLNYGIWTLLNGLTTWLSSWVDAFLIGRFLTDYYLGLYKTSANFITSIFTIVTASITPVLFSSLSKVQNDKELFKRIYLGIQKAVGSLVIPLGLGLALYSSFATNLFFGNKWGEATYIIQLLSITMAFRIVFIGLNGDVFRSKGHFRIPLVLDIIDLMVNIPLCYWAISQDFWLFVEVRAILRLFLVVPEFFCLWKFCGISTKSIFYNLSKALLASSIMVITALTLKRVSVDLWWEVISIIICIIIYFAVLLSFKKERVMLKATLLPKSRNGDNQ